MGCLMAVFAAFFPRFMFALFWLLRPARVDAAFDTFIVPLLGVIFLPLATLLYAVLYVPGTGVEGWEWFWIVVAGLFDVGHLAAGALQSKDAGVGRRGYDVAP